jgi:hypothetical protein
MRGSEASGVAGLGGSEDSCGPDKIAVDGWVPGESALRLRKPLVYFGSLSFGSV